MILNRSWKLSTGKGIEVYGYLFIAAAIHTYNSEKSTHICTYICRYLVYRFSIDSPQTTSRMLSVQTALAAPRGAACLFGVWINGLKMMVDSYAKGTVIEIYGYTTGGSRIAIGLISMVQWP